MTVSVNEIRKTFLNYFAKNDHKIVPSSSLVPDNDPTLMFANSGMVQFKNILAGNETRDYTRATSAQKSVRAGGKHNDLDSVGYDVRHHTFFEMLGNFSFGDYFKDLAIPYAWELLTKEFGLPKDRLVATVYHTDDEAYNLWKKVSGLPDDRIIRIATKDNFWQMGDTGPCGPCSEIFYDHGPDVWGGLPGTPEEDGDRYIEIWNLVFDQFEDLPDGTRINLKRPSIDTGMGLERISAILQGVHSNFETDTFQHIIKAIADIADTDPKGPLAASHNVIADHLRAICFLIADGVLPSNEGRGYVLRRIMRRAMRHAYLLGIKDPVIYKLLPTLQQEMGETYPELYLRENLIKETIKIEEERFGRTLDKGMRLLDEEVEKLACGAKLSGETAFKLYDTYGFPLDLTQDALKNKNIKVDVAGFDTCMAKQKAEARKNWAGSGDEGIKKIWYEVQDKCGASEFLGYSTLKADGEIKALVQNNTLVNEVKEGEFELVANQTPFYGECGGQVGDCGYLENSTFKAEVLTTFKVNDLYVHRCSVLNGEVEIGAIVKAQINVSRREEIRVHHTSAHLLQAALIKVVGSEVKQAGSYVDDERMRFDFTFSRAMTPEEIKKTEDLMNKWIGEDYVVNTKVMGIKEAELTGATALFGEKYGDTVRVVSIENKDGSISKEFCAGTHARELKDLRFVKIVSEGAIAAGTRRIELVVSKSALKYVNSKVNVTDLLSSKFKAHYDEIIDRVDKIQEENKSLQKEIEKLQEENARAKFSAFVDKAQDIDGGKLFISKVAALTPVGLKIGIEMLSHRLGKENIVVLAGDKMVAAKVSDGFIAKGVNAGKIVGEIARATGANGGGKPNFAQGGVKDASMLDEILAKIEAELKN